MCYRCCPMVVMAVLFSHGCASDPNSSSVPRITLQGVIAKSSVGGEYAFADFSKTNIRRRPIAVVSKLADVYVTEQNIKIEVKDTNATPTFDFVVIMGADLDTGTAARGSVITESTVDSSPSFLLAAGWALLSGTNVRAVSEWVAAGAEGTNIVLEIVNTATNRAYLLSQNTPTAKLSLSCRDGSPVELDTPGTYIEITNTAAGCTFSGPFEINLNVDRLSFIDELTEIADVAGWFP